MTITLGDISNNTIITRSLDMNTSGLELRSSNNPNSSLVSSL